MNSLKRLWSLSLLVKLVLAALIPLSADEAYYWVWSHNIQLSYYDHPPMVSWLFYLGHWLEPLGHAVRWPAVLLGHATLAVWLWILKDVFDLEKRKTFIYLVLFSPLLGFGSLIVTPDIPVLFFWSLALALTLQCLSNKSLLSYSFLGMALGLGFCSKYHIVLFVPLLLAYLSVEKRWKDVRPLGVFATAAGGLIFCAPVILWNMQNEWISFTFQLKHGLEKTSYNPEWTLSYLLGQILILFPLIVWAALKSSRTANARYLLYFGWGPLVFFFLTSFRALVEANWPIIAYPSVAALALFHPKIQQWTRYYVLFFGAIVIVVLSTLFTPSLRNLNEKVQEPYLFRDLSKLTEEFKPLYADSYQLASSLWYFSKVPVYKLQGISRFDFYDTLANAKPEGASFYLIKKERNGLPPWISREEWQVKELRKIDPEFVLLEFHKK
ncbi:MAG: glycosyltransferase family 39 protein [Bdellovibrio sp.]